MMVRGWPALLFIALPGVLAFTLSTATEAVRELASLAWRVLISFWASDTELVSSATFFSVFERAASLAASWRWRERDSWAMAV